MYVFFAFLIQTAILFCCSMLLGQASSFNLLDVSYNHNQIVPYKFLEFQKGSYIVFVHDDEGNHYVVKQEKGHSLSREFRAISEALCAHIAFSLDIPAQQVKILPVGMSFPGKFYTDRVGTLHTRVPGDTIRSSHGGLYSKLDIKQSTDLGTPFEQQGFNENTIFWIAQHSDLPLITSLDTFIGNKDRNKANVLYDEDTNSFYAIDMALMYDINGAGKSVAQLACEHVAIMIEKNKLFNTKEVVALESYRGMLYKLVSHFPPQTMFVLLDQFLLESQINKDNSFSNKDVTTLVNEYKRLIKRSYVHSKKLIYLLSLLINHQR